jgi:hypothetical protein
MEGKKRKRGSSSEEVRSELEQWLETADELAACK